MPRNGSGTYSIPTSFSPSTTISSSSVNANNADIGAEITNSLPTDGQKGMTGAFLAASGTVSAPGMSFVQDPDGGWYRIGGDNFGFACAGAKVLDVATTGLGITGTLSATGAITKNGVAVDSFASGTVMLFVQTAAPTGWTKGSAHDNKALRLVTGAASTGGSTAFTSVFASRTIAQANLPNVTLTSTSDGSHTHAYNASAWDRTVANTVGGSVFGVATGDSTGSNGAHTHTVPLGGSGTAMDFAVQYVDVISCSKD